MRSTRKVGYVQVDARRSFLGGLVVFALVGTAFVAGVVVGQQVESPLALGYEAAVVSDDALEALEVIAPGPRSELTLYTEIPDAREAPVTRPPRHTVTFSHDPVVPQVVRAEGELPLLELGEEREINASAIDGLF